MFNILKLFIVGVFINSIQLLYVYTADIIPAAILAIILIGFFILLAKNIERIKKEESSGIDVEKEIGNAIFGWCIISFVTFAGLTIKIDSYDYICTIVFMCISPFLFKK